uniref:HI1506-related protein n=1 Tax=Thaumasiovibrio occultus TaxID=1891184 RepID=UPI000B3556A4|nr:HI1506-related protein [Thaumasiovibrio occultus]
MSNEAKILVICAAASGYRRAGMAFERGENHIEATAVTDTQLAQLSADPRLTVNRPDAQASAPTTPPKSLVSGELGEPLTFELAVAQLSQDNPDHFTSGGKPQVNALETLMQQPVSAKQRDEWWQAYQADGAQE